MKAFCFSVLNRQESERAGFLKSQCVCWRLVPSWDLGCVCVCLWSLWENQGETFIASGVADHSLFLKTQLTFNISLCSNIFPLCFSMAACPGLAMFSAPHPKNILRTHSQYLHGPEFLLSQTPSSQDIPAKGQPRCNNCSPILEVLQESGAIALFFPLYHQHHSVLVHSEHSINKWGKGKERFCQWFSKIKHTKNWTLMF